MLCWGDILKENEKNPYALRYAKHVQKWASVNIKLRIICLIKMIPSISEGETYKTHKPCTAGVTLLVLLVMCVF